MKKEWYKTWWGIILCVLFFYILVPYLVWTKTNWNKNMKIGITVVCILLFIYGTSISVSEGISDKNLTNEAVQALNNNDVDKSLSILEKIKKNEEGINLRIELKKAKKIDFLYELGKLTENEYNALKNNNLNKQYSKSELVNKYIVKELKNIENKRDEALKMIEKQKIAEAKRKFEIRTQDLLKRAQFSLENYLKKHYLKDPNSYQHIDTEAIKTAGDDYTITINQKFIANNSFGGKVRMFCIAVQNINTEEFTNLQCGNSN